MSNQRPAKMHRAVMPSDDKVSLYSVLNFIKSCKTTLENEDMPEVAYYFEQIEEHIRENSEKTFNEKPEKVFGL